MKLKDFDFRIWDNGQKYAGDVVKKYMKLQGFSDEAEVELWSGFYDSKGAREMKKTDSREAILLSLRDTALAVAWQSTSTAKADSSFKAMDRHADKSARDDRKRSVK